jgi:hypothetical protein
MTKPDLGVCIDETCNSVLSYSDSSAFAYQPFMTTGVQGLNLTGCAFADNNAKISTDGCDQAKPFLCQLNCESNNSIA